jgi:hypothetical protein
MIPDLQDPPRIRDTDEGALLRASGDIDVPGAMQDRIRVALAEKLEIGRRPAWMLRAAVALGGALVVGGALAQVWTPTEPKPPVEIPVEKKQIVLPQVTSPVVGKTTIPVAPSTKPVHKPVSIISQKVKPQVPVPVLPTEAVPPVSVAAPASAPVPSHLQVQWQGRRRVDLEIQKGATSTQIKGKVNGVRVDLSITAALLYGHLDEESIHLVLRGLAAGGTARGHETGFSLVETERGLLLRGTVPGHTVRVELEDKKLSWFPGCENELHLREPGVFAGSCVQDRLATVVIPKAFTELPPLVRMILLGLVLTERDPVFDSDTTRLFPPLPAQR